MTAMEAADETSTAKVAGVVKGKRTKRHRLLFQPPTVPRSPPTSYSSAESSGSTTATEEEEDMANCLILLACGRTSGEYSSSGSAAAEKFSAYECKTCNKCFPTFQALGGHRASHKKPKLAVAAVDSAAAVADAPQHVYVSMTMLSPLAKLPIETIPKPKVHECSICGAEFSSGQALGGHMRRHRPLGAPAVEVGVEKQGRRSFLPLDLNLPPATTEDETQPEFTVASAFTDKPPLMFPAAALVGCHN